jgi:hypothetical protein
MIRSNSSTAPPMRRCSSGSRANMVEPWRPSPTANSAWMTPSWSSLAIRSRHLAHYPKAAKPLGVRLDANGTPHGTATAAHPLVVVRVHLDRR